MVEGAARFGRASAGPVPLSGGIGAVRRRRAWRCGAVSRRREGGECVGKGRGAWVWRALCLRQAARGRAPAGRSPVGTAGGGGALRRAAWGVGRRARGRALGKATVGVGGGEGGGVVACVAVWAAAVRRLLGRRRRTQSRASPRVSSCVARREGGAWGWRRGGVGCGRACRASTLGRPAAGRPSLAWARPVPGLEPAWVGGPLSAVGQSSEFIRAYQQQTD